MSTENEIVIEGTTREGTGKSVTRKLRRDGKIPAVLCEKGKSTSLTLDPKHLSKAWHGGKKFTLFWDGKKLPVTITELQIDYVKRLPIHVDLTFSK